MCCALKLCSYFVFSFYLKHIKRAEQGDHSFKNYFSGLISYGVFQETAPWSHMTKLNYHTAKSKVLFVILIVAENCGTHPTQHPSTTTKPTKPTKSTKRKPSNHAVAIAVGCSLAGLVLIVVIGYLIGRRRSRNVAAGYRKL